MSVLRINVSAADGELYLIWILSFPSYSIDCDGSYYELAVRGC